LPEEKDAISSGFVVKKTAREISIYVEDFA